MNSQIFAVKILFILYVYYSKNSHNIPLEKFQTRDTQKTIMNKHRIINIL